VLRIENAYCNIEDGSVKEFRKFKSEEISGGLYTRYVNRSRIKEMKNKVRR